MIHCALLPFLCKSALDSSNTLPLSLQFRNETCRAAPSFHGCLAFPSLVVFPSLRDPKASDLVFFNPKTTPNEIQPLVHFWTTMLVTVGLLRRLADLLSLASYFSLFANTSFVTGFQTVSPLSLIGSALLLVSTGLRYAPVWLPATRTFSGAAAALMTDLKESGLMAPESVGLGAWKHGTSRLVPLLEKLLTTSRSARMVMLGMALVPRFLGLCAVAALRAWRARGAVPCIPVLGETVDEDDGWTVRTVRKVLPHQSKRMPPVQNTDLFAEKDGFTAVCSLLFQRFPYDLPAQLRDSASTAVTSATFSAFPTNRGVRSW